MYPTELKYIYSRDNGLLFSKQTKNKQLYERFTHKDDSIKTNLYILENIQYK